jgi:2-dehydro-3-deoxyphosphogluconate aldolase/(4S)-4-hydroxy-2-oxoglutarate aldolase
VTTESTVEAIETLGRVRVVPVLTIDDADDAAPLIAALVDGGLTAVEITLRTPAGLDAIRLASAHCPDALIGAGSVVSAAAAIDAIDAGARFLVSPGLDPGTVAVAQERGVAVIPGVATATELLHATSLGVEVVKVFPAEQVGGPALIRAFAAVWPDVRFMPTGGISAATAPAYLALPQVLAVGGSWMVPPSAVRDRDWSAVSRAAAETVGLAGGES